jgi:hypothetical protein
MSELWLLSEAQMRRIEPYFPLSQGIPRVDDRRIGSGIGHLIHDLVATAWPTRVVGALVIAIAVGAAAPAAACSCISPSNLEVAGRAALASADLVADLDMAKPANAPPPRLWCSANGRARSWFLTGRKIEQTRPARVVRILKGRLPQTIAIRDSPIESHSGLYTKQMNSCDVTLAGRTGPVLLRRIGSNLFEPMDVCTQGAFTSL